MRVLDTSRSRLFCTLANCSQQLLSKRKKNLAVFERTYTNHLELAESFEGLQGERIEKSKIGSNAY